MIRLPILFLCILAGCSHASPAGPGQADQCRSVATACPACAESSDGQPISGLDAVALAEKFVKDNGYTAAPPLAPQDLTLESIERVPSREDLAEARHDSLQPRAYGYGLHGRGWIVVFCWKSIPEDEVGRAVTMYEDGSRIRMEHKDAILSVVEVKLRKCRE
jgi:hypothetical protein